MEGPCSAVRDTETKLNPKLRNHEISKKVSQRKTPEAFPFSQIPSLSCYPWWYPLIVAVCVAGLMAGCTFSHTKYTHTKITMEEKKPKSIFDFHKFDSPMMEPPADYKCKNHVYSGRWLMTKPINDTDAYFLYYRLTDLETKDKRMILGYYHIFMIIDDKRAAWQAWKDVRKCQTDRSIKEMISAVCNASNQTK